MMTIQLHKLSPPTKRLTAFTATASTIFAIGIMVAIGRHIAVAYFVAVGVVVVQSHRIAVAYLVAIELSVI